MSKIPTVHNPTNFDPQSYEVENYLDNRRPTYFGQGIEAYEAEVKFWESELALTFGANWHSKVHHCIHCGNGNVRWITAVRHLPTNDVVVFGSDCTKRLGFADKVSFKLALLQSRDAARKVRFAIWNKRQAFLLANPEFATAIETIDAPVHAGNSFAKDVVGKLNQWGSLSVKQVSAVVSSLARDIAKAAAPVVVEVKGDAPTGRIAVTGTVVSIKTQDGFYGPVVKMLVVLENNSKVWVTVPSKATIEKGQVITVTATWTPSKDDKSFGFGSRPTVHSAPAAA
jgi:hypothetical protein